MPANILFLFPDQFRFDYLGFRGEVPVRTPNLDALAAEGVAFDRCYTPSPLCSPARACLALGANYEQCGVPDNRHNIDVSRPTIYRRLREAGYRTGSLGKLDLAKGEQFWGEDNGGRHHMSEWGFTDGFDNAGKYDAVNSYRDNGYRAKDPYMAFLESEGVARVHHDDLKARAGNPWMVEPTPLSDHQYCDNWIAENALAVLRAFPSDSPWFLQVNFTGPHNPWDVPESLAGLYRGVDFPGPVGLDEAGERFRAEFAPEKLNAVRQNYAAMCENIDRQIGRLIDVVRERGEWENTVVIFASDHGEMLGDFGRWGKSTWHEASVRVPLVVRTPSGMSEQGGSATSAEGAAPGRRVTTPVQLQDIGATALAFAGAPPVDGDSVSLLPLLSGSQERVRERAYSALKNWKIDIAGDTKKLTVDGGSLTLGLDDRPV